MFVRRHVQEACEHLTGSDLGQAARQGHDGDFLFVSLNGEKRIAGHVSFFSVPQNIEKTSADGTFHQKGAMSPIQQCYCCSQKWLRSLAEHVVSCDLSGTCSPGAMRVITRGGESALSCFKHTFVVGKERTT
mmetsp:Transcript_14657/g.29770  ORF Transcript_14657/g.29770 Transcript_14657/m.29770 type:complete len:132 (+) Transcript_14657:1690-2085(+)